MLYLSHTRNFLSKVKWKLRYSWSEARRKDHVKRFRQYVPSLSDIFPKQSNAGRKPGQHYRQSEPDIMIDRYEINIANDDDGRNQPNNFSAEEIRFYDPRVDPPLKNLRYTSNSHIKRPGYVWEDHFGYRHLDWHYLGQIEIPVKTKPSMAHYTYISRKNV